nr:hypothetical protein CFP56_16567 [Quercus suber]
MFASFDLQAATLCPQFLAEARHVVNTQRLPDDYCTVAALLLLGLGCSGLSLKESFAFRGCEMAQRLQTSDKLDAGTGASTPEGQNMHRFRRHIITSASNVYESPMGFAAKSPGSLSTLHFFHASRPCVRRAFQAALFEGTSSSLLLILSSNGHYVSLLAPLDAPAPICGLVVQILYPHAQSCRAAGRGQGPT